MRRTSLLAVAVLAFVAACSDNKPTQTTSLPEGSGAVFSEHDPTNGSGACMLNDANTWPQFMSGWSDKSDPTRTNNCTTNDVKLAQSRATAYYNPNHPDAVDGFVPLQVGDNVQCTNGLITLRMTANLAQNSSSTRHDFGIWLRTDEGSAQHPLSAGARTGSCNHYNLPVNPLGINTVDADGDLCADMNQQASTSVDFGELTIPCTTDPGTSELIVHSCIAWKVPGDEGDFPKGQCPAHVTIGSGKSAQHQLIEGPNGFRAGSIPGNTSKCNCEPTGLQVFVAPGTIVIEKVTEGGAGGPFGFTTTGGLGDPFDLTTSDSGPAGKAVETFSGLSAGDYSVTESSLPAGWDLTDLTCSAGGVQDQNDPAKANITLEAGATVTCIFTNTKRGSIVIEKVTEGGFGGPFEFTTTGNGLTDFDLTTTAAGVGGKKSETFENLEPGSYSVTESSLPGVNWELKSLSCSAGGSQDQNDPAKANINLGAGQTVTCTFTNELKLPDLDIVKTAAKSTITPGERAEYTITVSNQGDGTAHNVVLTDDLPVPNGSGITWSIKSVSSNPTPTCNVNVGQQIPASSLSCSVAALAGGASFSVTVESSVIDGSVLQLDPEESGPIDIEGDLIGTRDWEGLWQDGKINCGTDVGCKIDLSGKDDDSFGGGVKEDTENPKITTGSIPPNKSDLHRFYVASERIGNGAPTTNALYLAWVRVQAPKGTTNMDFELNQSTTLYPNNATPVRSHGDILVKYDFDGGGSKPTLGFHRWLTGQPGDGACEASNSYPCWSAVISLSGSPHVDAEVNRVQVFDPIVNQNLDPFTFGEAYINLQGAGIFGNECVSFGKVFLKSRSSSSFNSDVKDFVRPLDVEISNCQPVPLDNQAFVEADNHAQVSSDEVTITITLNGNSSSLITAPGLELLAHVSEDASVTSGSADAALEQPVLGQPGIAQVLLGRTSAARYRLGSNLSSRLSPAPESAALAGGANVATEPSHQLALRWFGSTETPATRRT